jgi:hypothetical protein
MRLKLKNLYKLKVYKNSFLYPGLQMANYKI